MDPALFWMIVKNQKKWCEEYKNRRKMRDEIRKVINRKFDGKGGADLKANILRDLNSSLYNGELEIVNLPDRNEIEVYFDEELYTINKDILKK